MGTTIGSTAADGDIQKVGWTCSVGALEGDLGREEVKVWPLTSLGSRP